MNLFNSALGIASMVSERSFRRALSIGETLKEITVRSGSVYDPKIVALINRIDMGNLKKLLRPTTSHNTDLQNPE